MFDIGSQRTKRAHDTFVDIATVGGEKKKKNGHNFLLKLSQPYWVRLRGFLDAGVACIPDENSNPFVQDRGEGFNNVTPVLRGLSSFGRE